MAALDNGSAPVASATGAVSRPKVVGTKVQVKRTAECPGSPQTASGTKTADDLALSGCVAFARGHLAFEEVEHSARFSRAHFLAAGDGTGDDSGAVAKGLVSCRQAKALEGYGDVPELATRRRLPRLLLPGYHGLEG